MDVFGEDGSGGHERAQRPQNRGGCDNEPAGKLVSSCRNQGRLGPEPEFRTEVLTLLESRKQSQTW